MVVLGHGQKPIIMPSYPHMMAEDTEVWSKYLASPVVPIREVWYDVHVGLPVPLPVGVDLLTERIARGVTRKRIDVICRVGGGYWVVEIKPLASMLAVGQVISYTRLFVAEYQPDGQVWSVIVCDAADDDLRSVYEAAEVVVIVN